MSKRNIFIIILILFLILFVYIFTQISFNTTPAQDNITQNNMIATPTGEAVVIDEKALAVEEFQRSVGKSGLSNLYIVKCSACHGKDGKGPIGAAIAGKSYEYNFDKLMQYKENKIKNTMMKGLLDNTPIDELKTLAEEIANF